ncbi:hypothetical protein [uncultured Maribacter sp.]|uniref:hypothetical protein n=1 Tax=uncultured Maribacter sp. TaxID=431308 RepID=UPI0030EDB08C|tara:strand:- start:138798 stop:139349 length:552 start_codon:yes stop_codon:yes gene_type:complete
MSNQNNFIYIENVTERDLLKALQDLANLYSDSGYTDEIKLYRKKDNYDLFSVVFTNLPDFERFAYFVNYLYLPFELDKFEPKIKGFYQVNNIADNFEFKTKNWVQLFMTKDDTDVDEVSIVNEIGENYNYDFGGRVKKLSKELQDYNFIDLDLNQYYFITEINPNQKNKKSMKLESNPWWKFW